MTTPTATHPSLRAWAALRARGVGSAALVTLVRADGGASRSLGTHFALADDAHTVGSVTVGGCADGRALRAAQRVLASGRAEQLTLPVSEADALALGLGCAGDVDLLVERVSLDEHAGALAMTLDAASASVAAGESATLLAPLGRGGRLLVDADGAVRGTTGDAALDAVGAALVVRLGEVIAGARAVPAVHEHDGQRWFVEPLAPLRTLLIVGATDIAAALCQFAIALGWRTVLLDPRDEVLAQARFAAASERVPSIPAEVVVDRLRGRHAPAVVVVAHDYRVELPVLRAALAGDAPYVGMLGSRKRGASVRAMLADDGLDAARLARLRTPIGLAIGAEGPVEIAVSIVAELVATWRGALPPA
jgi:xanthine dehydrogenase accessory factor